MCCQVKVDSALAAHGTSYPELDRASSASSLGQPLFPRVPRVMASLQLPLCNAAHCSEPASASPSAGVLDGV